MLKIRLRNYLIVSFVYLAVMVFFLDIDKNAYIGGLIIYTLFYLIRTYREIKKEKK